MSEEQLHAFLTALAHSPELQEQIRADDADIQAIAAAAGFQLSAEDLKAAVELGDHELSADDLERVAGGNLIALLNRAVMKLNSLRQKMQDCVTNPLSTTSNQNDSKTSWCQSGKDVCSY